RRRLAGIYAGQKKFDEALSQFQALEQTADDPREARIKMGLIFFEKGDLDRAATEFNLVLAAAPKSWVVRYYLGAVYAERHETARALEEFGKIPPDSDYYVDARIRRAYLLQKDDLPEAVREIRAALGVKPDDPELMGYLASLYREQKDFKNAIELLERMVARFPDNDRYHFTLGAAYDEANEKERTLEQMRRAVELKRDRPGRPPEEQDPRPGGQCPRGGRAALSPRPGLATRGGPPPGLGPSSPGSC